MGARALNIRLLLLTLLLASEPLLAEPKAGRDQAKEAPTPTNPASAAAPAVPATPPIVALIDAVVSVDDAIAQAETILKAKGKDAKLVSARLADLVESGSDGQRWLALRHAELLGPKKSPLAYNALTALFASREQRLLDLAVRIGVQRYPDKTLTSLLEFPAPETRLALIKTLDRDTQKRLVKRLLSVEKENRFVILSVLKHAAALDGGALSGLVALLGDPEFGPAIIDLLLLAGRPGEQILAKEVGNLLRQRDGHQAAQFIESAAVVGESARLLVEPFLEARNDEATLAALHAMSTMTPVEQPIGLPLELITSTNAVIRERAIFLAVRGNDRPVIPALHEALSHKHAQTRALAAWALGMLGDADDEVILINAFRREATRADKKNREVRARMIEALGKIGGTNAPPVIINAMSRPDQRDIAVDAIVRFGKPAVPILIFILRSLDTSREAAVSEAIIRIGRPAAVDVSKLLSHPNKRVQEIGVSLLGIVGDEETAPLVEAFLRRENIPETQVLTSLRLYYYSMREVFLRALAGDEREAAIIALKTILNMKDVEVLPEVEKLLDNSGDASIRLLALTVLWHLNSPGIEARLLNLIQYEEPAIKLEALRAIRMLLTPRALPTVAKLLSGETREVEREAARTILRMTGLKGLDSVGRVEDWVKAWEKRQDFKLPEPEKTGTVLLGGGATLHYEIYGSKGPWLVVVPGGPDMSADYLRRWLTRLSSTQRVVLYDPRGRGQAKDPSSLALFDVTSEAADLLELLLTLGTDRADIVAHGYGSLVAMRLLDLQPKRIRRLIMASAPIPEGTRILKTLATIPKRLDDIWRDDYEFLERQGSKLLPSVYRRGLDRVMLRAYFRNPEWLSLLPDLHGDPMLRARLLSTLARLDLREVLDKAKTPVLVIQAKSDIYSEDTLNWYVALAKKNSHVHITTFGGSGHFPFVEENARFIETVRGFLK